MPARKKPSTTRNPAAPAQPEYVTAAEAATRVGVSKRTILNLATAGQVPGAIRDPHFGGWLVPVASIDAIPKRPRGRPWGTTKPKTD